MSVNFPSLSTVVDGLANIVRTDDATAIEPATAEVGRETAVSLVASLEIANTLAGL